MIARRCENVSGQVVITPFGVYCNVPDVQGLKREGKKHGILYYSIKLKFIKLTADSPMPHDHKLHFMQEAIALSRKGITADDGGPFGCIIVRNDEIVGRGWNMVIATNDPTAHAEVVAIRDACKNLGTFQLHDCEIYTSCEPCPMCMGAIYWARPKVVYYANNRTDAADIGFDDSMIYDELTCDHSLRKIPILPLGREAALKVFDKWKNKTDKIEY